MAPNAQILFFQGNDGLTWHIDDILHKMATSTPQLTVASCSLTTGRSGNSQQALDQMALNGTSFFTASGDWGDIGDPQCNLDMDNQTLVGGTFLLTNPLNTTPYYALENTWKTSKIMVQTKGVTGGGIMDGSNKVALPGLGIIPPADYPSDCFCFPTPFCCGSGVSIPDYQKGIMEISSSANGGSTTWRNYPDVAMLADYIEIFFNGLTKGSGTSAAAPLWAGFMALVNQKIRQDDPNAGLSGFINQTLYDIGLTSGSVDDLYKVCFNDINDGVSNSDAWNNSNGIAAGFKSVTGYDLCTGLGTPTGGLIRQLSSHKPLDNNQPMPSIRFTITTGNDDAGGGLHGSEQTVDVVLSNGGRFTYYLRHRSEANWGNWSTHTVEFKIPLMDNNNNPIVLTPSHGIAGIQIHHIQDNPDISADNWDIFALSVWLLVSPFPPPPSPQAGEFPEHGVCQLFLVGGCNLQDDHPGLVRLSKSAGSSGTGPSWQYTIDDAAGPDECPPGPSSRGPSGAWVIQFVIVTGIDDLRGNSSPIGGGIMGSGATADVLLPGGASFTVTLKQKDTIESFGAGETNTLEFPVPSNYREIVLNQGIAGVRINIQQGDNVLPIESDNWDIAKLRINSFSEGVVGKCLLNLGGNCNLADGSTGLVRLGPNGNGSSWQYIIDGGSPDVNCPPTHGPSECPS